MADRDTYDVAVVGASIAGCTAATLLARRGARVALIERHADPQAYKTVCTHFIQSSALPVLERLGVWPELMAAGAASTSGEFWTRWGWVRPPADSGVPASLNVRRQTLDPILRRAAAETPGVDLLLGRTVDRLLRDGERVTGVEAVARDGARHSIRARLVVGADGRGSRVAKLVGAKAQERPNNRVGYFAYYRNVPLANAPRTQMWFVEPDMAYAFVTDDDLTLLACMPTKERLPEFRRDPEGAFTDFMAGLPEGPPIHDGERVSKVMGKVDMTNVWHTTSAPGLALVGDAMLATDPLWGVGCGWALQSGEWLAETTADAVLSGHGLDRAVRRYRRRHRAQLRAYHWMACDFATGRPLNPIERLLYSAATRDDRVATRFEEFGTRHARVHDLLSPANLGRAAWVNARHAVRSRAAARERVPAGVA